MATPRLPIPGEDTGTWGDILNEFLSQVHKEDGSLKENTVTAASIEPGAVNVEAMGSNAIGEDALNAGAGSDGDVLVKSASSPGGFKWATSSGSSGPINLSGAIAGTTDATTIEAGAVETDALATAAVTTDKIANANVTKDKLAAGAVATAAVEDRAITQQKIATNAVDEALLADNAVTAAKIKTSVAAASDQYLRYNGTALEWAAVAAAGATTLDGLSDVDSASATDTQVLVFSGSTGKWVPGTVTSTTVSDATTTAKGIVRLAGDLGGDANNPTVVGLDAKAVDTAVVHKTGDETIAGIKTFSASPGVPSPTAGGQAANKTYVDNAVSSAGGTIPDADATTKGIIRLTGELGGTALSPTVPGLANKANNTVTVTGTKSLSGGGNLTTNRTLELEGDAAAPGNNKYYGTSASGVRGFYSLGVAALGWNTPKLVSSGTTIDTPYAASNNDWINADPLNSAIHIRLPAAVAGGRVRVKRVRGAGNAVEILAPVGKVFDLNEGTGVTQTINNAFGAMQFESDGTNWFRFL